MADNPLTVWLRNTIYRMTPKSEGDKQFAYLFKVGPPQGSPQGRVVNRMLTLCGSPASTHMLHSGTYRSAHVRWRPSHDTTRHVGL